MMFKKCILYATDDIIGVDMLRTWLWSESLPVEMVHSGSIGEAREKLRKGGV